MPRQGPVKLTERAVDALSVEPGDTVVWDRQLSGFGIRVYASGRKVSCVQTRGPAGGPNRFAPGRYGETAPDDARRKAAAVIDRIKHGLTPDPHNPLPRDHRYQTRRALHGGPCPGELPPGDGACKDIPPCRSPGMTPSRRAVREWRPKHRVDA